MTHIKKFIKLPIVKKFISVEALFWLVFFKIVLIVTPFRIFSLLLGKHMQYSEQEVSFQSDSPKTIARCIERIDAHLPWESKCLVKAAAGKTMLRLRGLPSTLILGVAKKKKDHLTAHAWLQYGNEVLIGAKGMENYSVIATFS